MTNPNDAALYLRFSDQRIREGQTKDLAQQRDDCMRYCEMANLNALEVYEDAAVSGRKTKIKDRKGGAALLGLADRGVKNIVVQRLDRFSRDSLDGYATAKELSAKGVALHFANQGGVSMNCETATGRMVFRVLLGFAEFEADLTSERTRDAMRFHQKNGRRMSARPPFGLQASQDDSGALIPCEMEQNTIKAIRLLEAKGSGLSEICRILTDQGHKPRGKKWHRRTIERILARNG